LKKGIFFAVLALVTVVCHTVVERYEKSGPEMLSDNWILRSSQGGRAEKKGSGLFLLVCPDPGKSVSLQQAIPSVDPGSVLNLSAEMACEDVVPGKKGWNLARLLLVQHDGKKDRWDLPHLVSSFAGTKAWGSYCNAFTVGPATQQMRVVAQLSRCTGSFELRNLHLYPVTQTRGYAWVKTILLSLWGIFSIFFLRDCFINGRKHRVLQAMLVVAFMAIIVATTLPGDMKNQVSAEVNSQIQATREVFTTGGDALNPSGGEVLKNNFPGDLSKVGHFCFFAVFGLILSLLMNRAPVLTVMVYILLLAGGTEMAQLYVDGRTALFGDFVIDAAGGLAGVMLLLVMRMRTDKPIE
jgi:hypothetical protein